MEVTGYGENEAFADSDIELEAGGKLMPVYTSYKFDKEGNYVAWEYFIFEDYSMTVPDDGAGGIYFEFNTFSDHMDEPDQSFLLMAEANDISDFSDVRAYHVIVEEIIKKLMIVNIFHTSKNLKINQYFKSYMYIKILIAT